jgi:hypothetical protein
MDEETLSNFVILEHLDAISGMGFGCVEVAVVAAEGVESMASSSSITRFLALGSVGGWSLC